MIRLFLVVAFSFAMGHTIVKAINNHIHYQLESMNDVPQRKTH